MDVYLHIAVFVLSYIDRGLKSALSLVKGVVSAKRTHKSHQKKKKKSERKALDNICLDSIQMDY
jgi:hypothetical protein